MAAKHGADAMTDEMISFGAKLALHAARRPDAPAVSCGAETLTYLQLHRLSNRLARGLAARGVKFGDLVTVGLPNSVGFVAVCYGIWKLGATPQPVSFRLPKGELQAIIDYVDEFYYGVRLFPGQDGSKVYVGWTTSRFHLSADKLERNFNQKDTSRCTLINTSSGGSIVSSLTRSECFVLSAIDLSANLNDQEFSSSKIVANSVLIGCMADLAAGIISFTFNGKETGQKLVIEPGTKLYPAVFVEPTTKEVLQIELGRVKNCLPLSAAMFPSLGKHVQPKCPPRLKLQYLQPIRWSRVPNANLKVHCLKMNNVLGWSLLCEEIGQLLYHKKH